MERYEFNPEFKKMMEKSPIPFAVYQFLNKRVVTLMISTALCEIMGYSTMEEAVYVMDHDMYRDAHPDDVARIADEAFRFATQGGDYDAVYRTRNPQGGAWRVVHAKGEHITTASGVRLAVVWYTDEGAYTPHVELQGESLIQQLSIGLHQESMLLENCYDRLTGLPNMAYFFQLAEAGAVQMLERGQAPAMLYFDFTGMKQFNLHYGFAEGDKLLQGLARVLVRHFSHENCGRLGQDHFAVYTDAAGLEDTLQLIFRECEALNEGKTLPVRAGIYLASMETVEAGVACDRAKAACDLNRDTYASVYAFFTQDLLNTITNRTYVLENLDRALAERWIQVYYQPIIRASSGGICDMEALSRWQDPLQGTLSPAAFIPLLEDARIIYKLDLYVVDRVLEDMARRAREGRAVVPVSVNLSRSDFDVCDMPREIARRVRRAGLPTRLLNIEITESVVGREFDYMKAQIDRFHEEGFQVWMDDFGSGYSSLDVLQKLDFELIKFDMTFMQQLTQSSKSRIILTELTSMANQLGTDTIAEGVETAEQARLLEEMGCRKLQGYAYSPPVPYEKTLCWEQPGSAFSPEAGPAPA